MRHLHAGLRALGTRGVLAAERRGWGGHGGRHQLGCVSLARACSARASLARTCLARACFGRARGRELGHEARQCIENIVECAALEAHIRQARCRRAHLHQPQREQQARVHARDAGCHQGVSAEGFADLGHARVVAATDQLQRGLMVEQRLDLALGDHLRAAPRHLASHGLRERQSHARLHPHACLRRQHCDAHGSRGQSGHADAQRGGRGRHQERSTDALGRRSPGGQRCARSSWGCAPAGAKVLEPLHHPSMGPSALRGPAPRRYRGGDMLPLMFPVGPRC